MTKKTTAEWYEDGLSLLQSGFFDSALECFDEVLRVEPLHASAWVLKGTTLARMERYDEAIGCFDKVLEIDPLNAEAGNGKALCLTKSGKPQEAAQYRAEARRIREPVEAPVLPVEEPVSVPYTVANGLASNTVQALAANEGEAWFVYGNDGGATRLILKDQRWRTYTQDDGLTSAAVRCVALGKKDVWLGTNRGVSRFDTETESWAAHSAESGLKTELINDLAIDHELLWMATDTGLIVLDTATGRSHLCQAGPRLTEVHCLADDGRQIWCGAKGEDGGLSVFDKQTGTFETLDVGPFVQGLQLFPLGGERKVWVAGDDRITIVDRTTHELEEISPPAILTTGFAAGVSSLLVGTGRGLAVVDTRESELAREVTVQMTDIGHGKPVTAICASRTREWIGIEQEGVLCLSYSS